MPVACLVAVTPAGWAVRAGGAAEADAEVPFVVLVPDGNSQIHHPGVFASAATRSCSSLPPVSGGLHFTGWLS
jgi:hypothetical protein